MADATEEQPQQVQQILTLDQLHEDLALIAIEKGLKNHIAAVNKERRANDSSPVRDAIKPGTYRDIEVDLTVKVGEVKVGEDYEQVTHANVDPWQLLGAAMRLIGDGKDLKDVIIESLNDPLDAKGKKTLKASAETLIRKKVPSSQKTCKGKVTVSDAVVEVNELKIE